MNRTEGRHRAGLLGLGAYVPERVMTNAEWAEHVDTSDEWIVERTGIRERRIAADDETTLDLAAEAAESALSDARLDASAIDEIVVATDTPEVYIPDTASYLQHRLGARNIPAYDLGASGCAGFVQALGVAKSRIVDEPKHVLVVGVELLTRLMNWRDRNTCVLFGDAAGAAVLGPADDERARGQLLAVTSGTDGSQADILTLQAGGTRIPFDDESAAAGAHHAIVMHGRKVFREAVRRMTEASLEVLDRAGLTKDDIALTIPHQANRRILDAVASRMEIASDRLFVNVDQFGNTGSASVPLALHQARAAGRISSGDHVLLTAFGAGFHWAAAVVRF